MAYFHLTRAFSEAEAMITASFIQFLFELVRHVKWNAILQWQNEESFCHSYTDDYNPDSGLDNGKNSIVTLNVS